MWARNVTRLAVGAATALFLVGCGHENSASVPDSCPEPGDLSAASGMEFSVDEDSLPEREEIALACNFEYVDPAAEAAGPEVLRVDYYADVPSSDSVFAEYLAGTEESYNSPCEPVDVPGAEACVHSTDWDAVYFILRTEAAVVEVQLSNRVEDRAATEAVGIAVATFVVDGLPES